MNNIDIHFKVMNILNKLDTISNNKEMHNYINICFNGDNFNIVDFIQCFIFDLDYRINFEILEKEKSYYIAANKELKLILNNKEDLT